ncbi:sigma factor-like helix-turn-helix DNA-binding protein [Streptomyces jumonjinensis]|uniref:RNA polymerase sigma-70 region 4 domain-containing protein n=1 Tax=Streptomyces jumonjinensis TaxID=1945 RepID=A0A646KAI9_STRJU|nr:sigma factor-like helix-turn-helix DNA-binding protein [Streptomyces jumonjinensis]MQS99224.1 hypothetical protein [Streptomyces jumonjinensis]
MSKRRTGSRCRRAREFEAFVAGAAGRLLHTATLLTAETPQNNPYAQRLLAHALAHTYAGWDRLRGEDPYSRARDELAFRFEHGAWRRRRTRGGVLDRLTPRERTIVVLRLYEGVAEEQTAAMTGLPAERVRTHLHRAVAALCAPPPGAAGRERRPAPTKRTAEASG